MYFYCGFFYCPEKFSIWTVKKKLFPLCENHKENEILFLLVMAIQSFLFKRLVDHARSP